MKKCAILVMSVVVMFMGYSFEKKYTNTNQEKTKIHTASVVYASNANQKNVYEDYNRLRRELWMNGKIEEARKLPCQVEKVRGAVWCYHDDNRHYYEIEGSVSRLENSNTIFFFTNDGRYVEHSGNYIYRQN